MSSYFEKIRNLIEQMPCDEIFVASELKKKN